MLLTLICGIACGLGLAGCSNNDESDNSPHEHNYSIKWFYDDTDHWHACTGAGCKEETDKTAHTWDEGVVMIQPTCGTAGGKVFTCTVCKITKTEIIAATGNHTFSDGWYEDNTYHWHVCEKCGSADNKEEHDWVDDVCPVCKIHKPSEGLEYELSSNGQYYSVTGIGTCADTDIFIPLEHNNKPVAQIGESAFV